MLLQLVMTNIYPGIEWVRAVALMMQKKTVDTLHNQGRAFTASGIPPAQIKPKYNYSDVYNLNSLFKGN